jgi:hypothetical protein
VGALNGAHILGTLMPVEEPSTASKADISRGCLGWMGYVRSSRGAITPQTTKTMIAPTIAPMKPASSPALYHPTAWPRYVAAKAPTIPSKAVKINPLGSNLLPG